MVHWSFKPSMQYSEATTRVTNGLCQLSKAFHCKDRHSFVMLYKQYVRPHQLGRPWLPRTRSWSYCRWRTDGLRLTSSRPSKSSRGFNDVNRKILFTLDGENPTRLALHSHDPLNIVMQHSNKDTPRNLFLNRVVEAWNDVP